jgi:membrane-associated protein
MVKLTGCRNAAGFLPNLTQEGKKMNLISYFIDLVLHLDKHLVALLNQVGALATYAVLFGVIFIETGIVIFPFLPGDSLLFAAGSLAALPNSPLNIIVLWVVVAIAAILGDTVNYRIGHSLGERVYTDKIRFIKKEHLDRTHSFYEKHGGITIFIARFIPIIRTFAPFVAGVGEMSYGRFLSYNVLGGITWTALFTFGGYFFGNLKFVQDNFSFVIIAIIVISFTPVAYELAMAKWGKKETAPKPQDPLAK